MGEKTREECLTEFADFLLDVRDTEEFQARANASTPEAVAS